MDNSKIIGLKKRITQLEQELDIYIQDNEKLLESELNWRLLTDNSPDHILTLDTELKIRYANYASPGLTVEDLIGTPLYTYVEKNQQEYVKKILENVLKTGDATIYETEYNIPDGKKIYYESRVVPRYHGKKIIGVLLSARDITDHKATAIALNERVKELNGLINLGKLSEQFTDIDELLTNFIKDIVPGSIQFSDKVCARLELDEKVYTLDDKKCINCLTAPLKIKGLERGSLTVGYTEQLPFIEFYEKNLIEGYAERLSRIIERTESEKAILQVEQRYRLAERAANIGSWEWDIVKGKLYWSDTIEPMFGFKPGKFGKTYEAFLECVHPDDRKFVIESVNMCVEEGRDYDIEHRIIWPDGTLRWVSETGDVFRDEKGKAIQMLGVVRDITRRKEAEKALLEAYNDLELKVQERTAELANKNIELQNEIVQHKKTEIELESSRAQLREHSLYLESVREEERTRISREIHDGLGQYLTVLKMDLTWLKNNLPENQPVLLEKTGTMSKLIDDTIGTVQKIASELRPSILDDLGLVAAVEWLINELEKRSGIKFETRLSFKENWKNKELSTTIFRILQESITNIIRHSKASKVKIDIHEKAEDLLIEVADNGIGINKKHLSDKKSFGLLGMRERIRPFKGELEIIGIKNKGTTVKIAIPDYNSVEMI
ncbi:PAS domain-containing protein [candidate division KSB1 bacterium]